MKKIMIIAAVAAMGAYADNCTPTPQGPTTITGADIYQLQMQVKTTKGVKTTQTIQGTAASWCTPGSTNTFVSGILRTQDNMNISGWIGACTNLCVSLENYSLAVIWDTSRRAQMVSPSFSFKGNPDPDSDGSYTKLDTQGFIHVIGTRATEAEIFTDLTGRFAYARDARGNVTIGQRMKVWMAALGQYSNGKYRSFSGSFAGWMEPSYLLTTGECTPSAIYRCLAIGTPVNNKYTVAYGNWSLRYNQAAGSRYWANSTLQVPNYVTY